MKLEDLEKLGMVAILKKRWLTVRAGETEHSLHVIAEASRTTVNLVPLYDYIYGGGVGSKWKKSYPLSFLDDKAITESNILTGKEGHIVWKGKLLK